ncbi:carboxypeptidase-like regulatory domain-containing protein [Flaviaesturariibacter flavus]|nr:carboxypeptidase-like regulatory domain-containing protein [Flaviaesturariibacter flavus]
MAQHLHIEIPSACHEQWHDMEARANGRYCGSCRKTVIDFTNKTDAELAEYFRNYTGGGCGRFHNDQLNRVLTVPRRPLPGLRYFFAVTLPAFLWSLKSEAQTTRPATEITAAPCPTDPVRPAPNAKSPVSGSVIDANDYPVPFLTVTEKGTRNSVTADANGRYTIRLSRLPAQLLVTSTGYQAKEYPVDSLAPAELPRITLQRNAFTGNEEVVIAGMMIARRVPAPRKAPEMPPPALRTFPNPVSPVELLKVTGERLPDGTYTLQLWSLSGALLRDKETEWKEKRRKPMVMESAGLAAGTYVLRAVHNKTGKTFSQQVVLQ